MEGDAVSAPAGLYDCIRAWAEQRPHAEAVVESPRRLDYAGLCDAVAACAAAMVAAGLRRGDRVATLAAPGIDFLVTFLAAAAAGGIWIGLNPRYTAAERDALLARVRPRLVFFGGGAQAREHREWAGGLPAEIIVVACEGKAPVGHAQGLCMGDFVALGSTLAPQALAQRIAEVDPTHPCLMVFTSGSTGTPKGTLISQAALVGASRVQLRVWPVAPLRVLDNLPINHIGCVGDLACYALVGGGTVVFMPGFDPVGCLTVIRDERVTVWGQVPTMFQIVLETPGFDPAALASVRLLFWGGAHAPPALVQRLATLAPWLATSYGQTETVGSVTFTARGADLPALTQTVGRVVTPYEIRIAGLNGGVVPAGVEGEVQVRTPYGMSGYWCDPDATARARDANGWQRTGDVGVLTDDGQLRLIGRVHDVFKSGGYNIHPPEIEAELAAHPCIRQASLVDVPDALFGHVGVAFVVRECEGPDEDDLRAYLRERIANYKVPKRIFFVDALPQLAVGKIDKRALRARAHDALFPGA